MVRNWVLTKIRVNRNVDRGQAKTYLDDLKKFFWAINASNR
jgi:hypothetical protein